jgi:hypothetical protein
LLLTFDLWERERERESFLLVDHVLPTNSAIILQLALTIEGFKISEQLRDHLRSIGTLEFDIYFFYKGLIFRTV